MKEKGEMIITAGQKFRFREEQRAVMVRNPFGGQIEWHVPATWYREHYRQTLLENEIAIPMHEVFRVVNSWETIYGDMATQAVSEWRPNLAINLLQQLLESMKLFGYADIELVE